MAGTDFQPPQFTLPLKSLEAPEGGTARLEAVVIGFPIPAVTWLHNGEDVTNSINYEISTDSAGRCVLYIPEVFDEDAGVFTCYATNGAGEADSSAELVVKIKTEAPEFTQHLIGVSVRQGEPARFEVRTSGLPAPRVKWYREGAEIRHSDDFRIVSAGDVHSLTITEAYEEDTGRFTVTATNHGGKATSTAMLTVSGEGSVASSRDGDFVSQVSSASAMQVTEQKTEISQQARGRIETSRVSSDMDFVQTTSTQKEAPSVAPKPMRKQSPSPIRKVRMSPPRMRVPVGSQQSPLPRRQIRSVKPPSASPPRSVAKTSSQTATTDAQGKPKEQAESSKVIHSVSTNARKNCATASQNQAFSWSNSSSKSSVASQQAIAVSSSQVSSEAMEVSGISEQSLVHESCNKTSQSHEKMEVSQKSSVTSGGAMTSQNTSAMHRSATSSQICARGVKNTLVSSDNAMMTSQDTTSADADMSMSNSASSNISQSSHIANVTSKVMTSDQVGPSIANSDAASISCHATAMTSKSSSSSCTNAPATAVKPPKVIPPPALPTLPPSLDYREYPRREIPGVRSVQPASFSRKRPLSTVSISFSNPSRLSHISPHFTLVPPARKKSPS